MDFCTGSTAVLSFGCDPSIPSKKYLTPGKGFAMKARPSLKNFLMVLASLATLSALQISTSNASPATPSSQPVSCQADDMSTVPVVSSTQLDDGGTTYTFQLDGSTFNSSVPPSNFDPVTATDDQLQTYGFPPRPTNPTDLQQWTQTWQGATISGAPAFCEGDQTAAPVQQLRPSPSDSSNSTSYNWAGTIAHNDTGQFVAAEGDWPQSGAKSCGCSTSDTDESTWVGLGGDNTQALLQAGTDMQGTGSSATLFAWWEYLHKCPSGSPGCNPYEIPFANLSVSAGDPIHVYISYQTSNNLASFLLCDAGSCKDATRTLDSSYFDGSTAEQIDERPSFSCGSNCQCYKALTNFVYNNWTNMQAEYANGNWIDEGDHSHELLNMVDYDKSVVAGPTSNGDRTMHDVWDKVGSSNRC